MRLRGAGSATNNASAVAASLVFTNRLRFWARSIQPGGDSEMADGGGGEVEVEGGCEGGKVGTSTMTEALPKYASRFCFRVR